MTRLYFLVLKVYVCN